MKKEATILILLSIILIVSGCDASDPQLSKSLNKGDRGPIGCGSGIYGNVTLSADILNCNGDGLIMAEDYATLDCAGHKITSATNNNIGIRSWEKSHITIKNCTVEGFWHGMKFVGYTETGELSTNVIVQNNIIRDSISNIGLMTNYLLDSQVSNNKFENNGLYMLRFHEGEFSYNKVQGSFEGLSIGYQFLDNKVFNNIFSDNMFGMRVWNNAAGTQFFNNSFFSNQIMNVEDKGGAGTDWNISIWGNYWDDFSDNQGYPDYYVLSPWNTDYSPICEGIISQNQCSEQQPAYCDYDLSPYGLVDNCQECGCPSGERCLASGSCTRILGTHNVPEQV